jgi:hypothetical protein
MSGISLSPILPNPLAKWCWTKEKTINILKIVEELVRSDNTVRRHSRISHYELMKQDSAFIEIRAGVISSLVLAIGYLCVTGLSSQLRVWAFIALVAVCFVLMMKSLVDLLVWAFGLVAACSGKGFGKTVRFIRCL